jgi:hypothetical protein
VSEAEAELVVSGPNKYQSPRQRAKEVEFTPVLTEATRYVMEWLSLVRTEER